MSDIMDIQTMVEETKRKKVIILLDIYEERFMIFLSSVDEMFLAEL